MLSDDLAGIRLPSKIPTGSKDQMGKGRLNPVSSLASQQKKEIWDVGFQIRAWGIDTPFQQGRFFVNQLKETNAFLDLLGQRNVTVRRLKGTSGYQPALLDDRTLMDLLEITLDQLPSTMKARAVDRLNEELALQAAPWHAQVVGDDFIVIPWPGGGLGSLVIEPVLQLGGDPDFKNAAAEYGAALALLRPGSYGDASHKACNAMEAAGRAVAARNGIDVSRHSWASLVAALSTAGIVPGYLQNSLGAAVANVRNQPGSGHGPNPGEPAFGEEEAYFCVLEAGAVILYLVHKIGAIRG